MKMLNRSLLLSLTLGMFTSSLEGGTIAQPVNSNTQVESPKTGGAVGSISHDDLDEDDDDDIDEDDDDDYDEDDDDDDYDDDDDDDDDFDDEDDDDDDLDDDEEGYYDTLKHDIKK